MSEEKRATLEVIAPTVEEAVDQGLAELGLSREQVDVEVLDEGTKGIFGLGNRQTRVRLTLKGSEDDTALTDDPSESVDREKFSDLLEGDDDTENVQAIVQATVSELLEKMNIHHAKVSTRISEETGRDGLPTIIADIEGDDLSILIGKRSETLNALQYITRLILGKEVGRGVNLVIDVEGYRARRERSLRQLAEKMANQAIKSNRRQNLEPMPANERRIIHLALRDNDEVSTESVGEEPRRKVTIIPN